MILFSTVIGKISRTMIIFLHNTEAGSLYFPQALKYLVKEYLNIYSIDGGFLTSALSSLIFKDYI